jgi:hypothetical protein
MNKRSDAREKRSYGEKTAGRNSPEKAKRVFALL